MPRYYLGVDGGQSSTTAVVSDESGEVLGSAVAGPCNHVSGPEAIEKFRRVIGGCVAECCRSAQLSENIVFTGVCCGFSGGPEDKDRLTRELIRGECLYVTHDAEIALSGALAGKPGIIVISGTGSIAFGKNAAGRTVRTGGWGYVIGDEGGAFDITRRAIRAALRLEEGWGQNTALHRELLNATGAASMHEVMHALYTPEWPRSRSATLAKIVTSAAEDGDAVALQVLEHAAVKLVQYAHGVYCQLFAGSVLVSPVGGTFQSHGFRAAFDRAAQDAMSCEVVNPKHDPVVGAVLIALEL